MHDVKINRRRFLQGSGGLLLGTLLFGSGPIALLAPSRSWAMEMNTLSSDVAAKLLLVIRRIYPHDRMEDAVYAFAVKALDERAATDPSVLPCLIKVCPTWIDWRVVIGQVSMKTDKSPCLKTFNIPTFSF